MASIKITSSSPECAGVAILGFSADALKEISSLIANEVGPIRNKIQQIEKSIRDALKTDQDALKSITEQFASLQSIQKQPMESTVGITEPKANKGKVGDKSWEMEAEVVEPRKKQHEFDQELAGIQEDGATYVIYYRDMLGKKDEDFTEKKIETLVELFEIEDVCLEAGSNQAFTMNLAYAEKMLREPGQSTLKLIWQKRRPRIKLKHL